VNRRRWLLSLLTAVLLTGCARVDPNEGFPGFHDSPASSAQAVGGGDTPSSDAGAGQPSDAAGVGAPRPVTAPDPPASPAAGSVGTGGTVATGSAKASTSGLAVNHAPTSPATTSRIGPTTTTSSPAARPTTAKPSGGLTLPN
jgi:hypothetical protein